MLHNTQNTTLTTDTISLATILGFAGLHNRNNWHVLEYTVIRQLKADTSSNELEKEDFGNIKLYRLLEMDKMTVLFWSG